MPIRTHDRPPTTGAPIGAVGRARSGGVAGRARHRRRIFSKSVGLRVPCLETAGSVPGITRTGSKRFDRLRIERNQSREEESHRSRAGRARADGIFETGKVPQQETPPADRAASGLRSRGRASAGGRMREGQALVFCC